MDNYKIYIIYAHQIPSTNINYHAFVNMAPDKEFGTVLINVGRSNIVKEDELLEALEKNWIREAVIDVFDQGIV